MKPLTANLKTLYQSPKIWLFHGILMIVILMLLEPIFIKLSLLFILWYGVAIGSITRGLLSKPFAFCLSGHVKEAQRMPLLVWLVITIVYALLFFMDLDHRYALFVGSIGLISLSYWLGVVIIIPKGRYISFATFLIIILTLQRNPNLNTIIEQMSLTHAWAIAFVGGILSYLIYRAVGSKENVRRLCAMPWLGSVATNIEKQNRFNRERMRMKQNHKPDRAALWSESFFLERIRSNQTATFFAHLWGQVYLTIGSPTSYWRGILIGGFCILILNCFPLIIPSQETPQQGVGVVFSIIACIGGACIFIYYRYAVFLLIGRKEHLWRGVVFLFTATLIVLGFMVMAILYSNLISGSLFPIMFDGRSYLPRIRWVSLIIPVLLIPLFGGLIILFKKGGGLIAMSSTIILVLAASLFMVEVMESRPFVIHLLIIFSTAVITWGFHLAVLYYDSMKRSLC